MVNSCCWRCNTFQTQDPGPEMYLIWKHPPWRLAPMVQEVIIQPSKRGKQPIVIPTCGACDPQQQPAWQQWHAVSCGRKQIGLIGFSTWGKLPAVGDRQLPRASEVMGFGEKNDNWDFTNTGTVIICVLNTLMPTDEWSSHPSSHFQEDGFLPFFPSSFLILFQQFLVK